MLKKINYSFFFIFLSILLINGCREPDSNYYVINKVRVVAALFQNGSFFSGSTITNTAAQQFPLRLFSSTTNCSTTNFYIVAISPTAEVPTITINSIVLFAIGNNYLSGGGGARGVSAGRTGANVASSFFFTTTTPTTTVVQTTPYRLTVFSYPVNCANLTTENLKNYTDQLGDIPGFQLSYTVSSSVSTDQGFYSFYFLPDSNDGWWTTNSFPSGMTASKVTQIKNGLAVTNNPIQISSVTPSSSTISGGSGATVTANITVPAIPSPRDSSDSIFSAKTRVQWYVSTGNLNLDTASSTSWNPGVGSSNSVGGFVVVRDLLGGIDFKILGPFTTQ